MAERFSVSARVIRKLLARRRATGSVAARPPAGGFASRVDAAARAAPRDLVGEQPDATRRDATRRDATLVALRDRRRARAGVSVAVTRVCQVLQELAPPRKKRRTRPASNGGRT